MTRRAIQPSASRSGPRPDPPRCSGHSEPRAAAVDHVPGTTRLLHAGRPYKQAQHFARDLNSRLAEHQRGTGARLLEVVSDAGIGWHFGTSLRPSCGRASSRTKAAGSACGRPASTPPPRRLS
jgi:hypothetical protein